MDLTQVVEMSPGQWVTVVVAVVTALLTALGVLERVRAFLRKWKTSTFILARAIEQIAQAPTTAGDTKFFIADKDYSISLKKQAGQDAKAEVRSEMKRQPTLVLDAIDEAARRAEHNVGEGSTLKAWKDKSGKERAKEIVGHIGKLLPFIGMLL